MRRVVCVYLPTWPTDRLRRKPGAPPAEQPLITARRQGSRRLVAGADVRALDHGLRPGMTVALAQAMTPGLTVVEANPEDDAAALERLAAWALRYTPLAAADLPDGLVLDVAGAAHLVGGEAALIDDLTARLSAAGITAQVALADTLTAAWGLARFAPHGTIAAKGEAFAALAPLPVAALRLNPDVVAALNRLGFDTVADLAAADRPALALRFGTSLTRCLDQARGLAHEAIDPVRPLEVPGARLAFAEPLMHANGLRAALARLAEALCTDLERMGLGARRLDLFFTRVDNVTAALRVGTARGTRDPAHMVRLLSERLDTLDPGFGVEAAGLSATRTERLDPCQLMARGEEDSGEADLAPLIDRIAGRIGTRRLYRVVPVESDLPERCERRVAPLTPPAGRSWHDGPRPTLVLSPPEPVEVVSLLPDHPPRAFVWRGQRTKVANADGPERVHGEWWRSEQEVELTRDYFRIEATDGLRYWLFRTGDGTAPARWFLAGAFG